MDELVDQGKLVHRPSGLLEIAARDMFVTPEIDVIAKRPFADTELGERHAAVAVYLDAFAELNEITVSENPFTKPRDTMLARVHPAASEFWSMRITDPEETAGMRILGGFCGVDAFVGLTCELREHITDFDSEVDDIHDAWADFFGTTGPYSGESLDDYLTNHHVRE